LKDYLGEKSFKSSPGKSGKPHSQIKAAQQILQRKSTPLKAGPDETKKKMNIGKPQETRNEAIEG